MPSPVHPGQILAGKYRVERVLGEGGMGVVVSAIHVHLDERVALKFLLPEIAQHAELVTRFLREGRAAVKIRSEHVARVTDVGTLDNGAPYMVMEYLHGHDLARHLTKHGRLPVPQAIEAILQAGEAIAEAHAIGIIHRDLKPANLFVTTRADGSPCVKVLDFGISKVTQGADAAMTKTASLMGSPLYMSPEQMASAKDVDARTDVWALGVILYELIAGRPPFVGESLPEICAAILQGQQAPLASHGVMAPAAFEAVLTRSLQKNRSARYASLADLAIALVPFATPSAHLSIERIRRIAGASMSNAAPQVPLGTGTIAMSPDGPLATARGSRDQPPSPTTGTVVASTSALPTNPSASTTSGQVTAPISTARILSGDEPLFDATAAAKRRRIVLASVAAVFLVLVIVAIVQINGPKGSKQPDGVVAHEEATTQICEGTATMTQSMNADHAYLPPVWKAFTERTDKIAACYCRGRDTEELRTFSISFGVTADGKMTNVSCSLGPADRELERCLCDAQIDIQLPGLPSRADFLMHQVSFKRLDTKGSP